MAINPRVAARREAEIAFLNEEDERLKDLGEKRKKEAAEKSAAKEKEIDELDLEEILEYKYDPVKAVTTEPIFFRDEDREEEEKSPLWEMEFIKNFKAEQAKKNKENDLLGAKDYEKFLERENQKKEEIRKSKENDLPGYRPWEKKYEFMDYYDQKQIFTDSMAFRLGVSQEKLDEIKKEAETKDKSNVLTATFNSGGATTSAAITGGLDILLGKPLQTLGWKNNPISVVNNYYQNLSKKKYNTMMKEADETGLGKPMEYAARFSSSLVSAIPTAIIAYLSAGTSLAAQGGSAISSILSNPAFWYSFETSLYPEYQNALMNGATENEATIVATMASLFDAGIEVVGGLERLPKIMQNPGTRNKILKNWVKVAIDEGNESVLQDMTSELTQKIIFDHGKDWVSFDKDNNAVLNVPKSLENWLTSAAIGGVLSAPVSVKSILSKNAADFVEHKNFDGINKEGVKMGNALTSKEIEYILNYRSFANGYRKPISHELIDSEIDEIRSAARILGIPDDVLLFNEGSMTGFDDDTKKIFIRGNILPDLEYGNTVRDKLSIKAVLAHEYYGHYKNHPSAFKSGDWQDEFRASYDAAINAPNLSDEERAMLILDAYDRAKEAGIYLDYNDKAREILYGK